MSRFTDTLLPASFRGVPFGVLDASDSRGRNTVIHEFPLRDKVYVEDLGRAKRTIQLTAFVANPGYILKRDALIAALETAGPGTLVHPWLGTFNATLTAPATITHSYEQGGYCAFQLQFTEDWTAETPGVSLDWPSLALAAEALAIAEACLNLDALFIVKSVFEEALAPALELVRNVMAPLQAICGLAQTLPVLAGSVSSFVSQITRLGSVSALLKRYWPDREYRYISQEVIRKEASFFASRVLGAVPYEIPPDLGTYRLQIAINRKAVIDFDREMSGIAAITAYSYVIPESAAEADTLRSAVTEIADILLGTAVNINSFKAIQRLHVTAQRAIAEAAGHAPEVFTVEESQVSPVWPLIWRHVLAGSQSSDLAGAFADFVRRNKIIHPGFVPAGALEAVSGQARA